MSLKVIVYVRSLLFTSCRYNLTFSPNNIQCWYVTLHLHQVLKLSRVNIQVKERNHLTWFFKEIANNPSAVSRVYMEEHINNYSALGERQIGFEYYRSFSPDTNDDKELATTTFNIILLLFVPGDDKYSILDVDHPTNILLISIQILAFEIDILSIIFPLSGYRISKEQPQFIAKQLFNFFWSRLLQLPQNEKAKKN